MCSTCGCGQPDEAVTIRIPGENVTEDEMHVHSHGHEHHHHHHHEDGHHHHHDHGHSHDHHHHHEVVDLEADILQKNNLLAERNRGYFEAKQIVALNMMSAPGSGKTTLLEQTINSLKDTFSLYVIEGDQQTMNDAERISATGAKVAQVNTGKGCHLDSEMVNKAIKKLNPAEGSIVCIENVGNLVCPALFDLGEQKKVVIMSVTEGEDKPIKYPHMFQVADICIINKIDLLPYVDFDVKKAKEYALQVNHHLEFVEVSAKTGQGMDEWLSMLKNLLKI
jgi:hydrogenase nickel incorporation protein HypB